MNAKWVMMITGASEKSGFSSRQRRACMDVEDIRYLMIFYAMQCRSTVTHIYIYRINDEYDGVYCVITICYYWIHYRNDDMSWFGHWYNRTCPLMDWGGAEHIMASASRWPILIPPSLVFSAKIKWNDTTLMIWCYFLKAEFDYSFINSLFFTRFCVSIFTRCIIMRTDWDFIYGLDFAYSSVLYKGEMRNCVKSTGRPSYPLFHMVSRCIVVKSRIPQQQ